MPQQIRAVVVDPGASEKLAIKPVELRDPDRDEVVVRVTAISLNRGETRRALTRTATSSRSGSRNSTGHIVSFPEAAGSTTTARICCGISASAG